MVTPARLVSFEEHVEEVEAVVLAAVGGLVALGFEDRGEGLVVEK